MPSLSMSVAERDAAVLRQILRLLAENAEPEAVRIALEVNAGVEPLAGDIRTAVDVAEQLAYHKKRERELIALYDTARDITASGSIDKVLRSIVVRARQLIGCDISYISALEDDGVEFTVRATEGCITPTFEAMKVPRGFGICSQVLESRQPCHSANYLADRKLPRHPKIDAVVQAEGIISLLGVPLEIEGRVIGVLFVGDRFVRSYPPPEVAGLSSLAALAAIAIRNARHLDAARIALASEQRINDGLNAKALDIQAAGDAHERMLDLVARGGRLEDLATLLSGQLDCRVGIVDQRGRALCVSGSVQGIAAQDQPDVAHAAWQEAIRNALRRSAASPRSMLINGNGAIMCRLAMIRGGSDLFGGVVAWRLHDLPEAEVRTLERCAMVSAIVLLSNDRLVQAANRDIHDLVADLLREPPNNAPADLLSARLADRGLQLTWPLGLYLVELDGIRPDPLVASVRSRLQRQGVLASDYEGDLVVLSSGAEMERISETLQAIVAEVSGINANIVISEPIATLGQMPQRYRSAKCSLHLLRALGHRGKIVHDAMLSIYAAVFRDRSKDDIAHFVDRSIGALRAYDEIRSTRLAETLLKYLDNSLRLQRTADELGIHVNTLRQRLSAIREICGDWDDPSRVLETHLALKLHALAGSTVI
ncbi:GAF domain-containing protein [Xanthobacter sp. 126]|uniref:helix-turn-helix domain-containing protein n=1 Tax=Xanthobacter sp. 126 TaxID=1131814 RepID=UPI00045EC59B|nr:GAF domain-containing protein [Xanthobacter sp. 126]